MARLFVDTNCKQCGEPMASKSEDGKTANRLFCGRPCYNLYQKQNPNRIEPPDARSFGDGDKIGCYGHLADLYLAHGKRPLSPTIWKFIKLASAAA